MSVEALVLAAVIEEGNPKKAFQAGVMKSDFPMYDDEWEWIIGQTERGKPLNWRRFQQEFPDFERVVPDERLQDLCEELKLESAYATMVSAIQQVAENLKPDNTLDQADFLRDVIADVLRIHSPASDVILSTDVKSYLQRMKDLQALRETGIPPGIPTNIPTLDHHLGGLVNGRAYLFLGRPGDAKSFFIGKLGSEGFLDGRRVGMFSPEMNEDEHRARIATIISADKRVQEEIGLTKAFRNRALLDGRGYNYKTLKRFWEWMPNQPGALILHTNKHRRLKMTPNFIESRIDDLGLEMLIVDPIYKLKPNRHERGRAGWERLQELVDEVVDMSKTFNIPVVITNQAHRQQGNRGDAPHKDNSFGGDSPVQEADAVIGLKHLTDDKRLIVRCTKNRWGDAFRVDLKFLPNIGMFQDMSKIDGSYYNGHEDGSDDTVKEAIKELEREMEHDAR